MCIRRFINILCNYFKPEYKIYELNLQTINILKRKKEKNKEMYKQKLYHNLTYDHGICMLN